MLPLFTWNHYFWFQCLETNCWKTFSLKIQAASEGYQETQLINRIEWKYFKFFQSICSYVWIKHGFRCLAPWMQRAYCYWKHSNGFHYSLMGSLGWYGNSTIFLWSFLFLAPPRDPSPSEPLTLAITLIYFFVILMIVDIYRYHFPHLLHHLIIKLY